jgi:hypothetical protein
MHSAISSSRYAGCDPGIGVVETTELFVRDTTTLDAEPDARS